MNGKGDSPRPLSVDSETFASNWERIFSKKKTICEYSGLLNTESYDAPTGSEVDDSEHPRMDDSGN
jgi:hypothetical protein